MEERRVSDVGGTPGGLGHFLMGFAMACVGGYLLCNQVTVVGSYWMFRGENAFGITLLPMLFGIGLLFWLIARAQRGDFSAGYVAPIENFGLYWHFVDIVWLFLFPLLYLINRHPLAH